MRASLLPKATVALVGMMLAAACGDGPTVVPPPPAAPTVSCPAAIAVESPDNVAMPVTFSTPTPVGGQAPVSVSCSSSSGANFPLGSTTVTCTASDALQRASSCNFIVTVTPTPRVSKTKFLAFGDSITFGRCNGPDDVCPAYTVRLRQLLEARYTRQSFSITTLGKPGENASDDIPPGNGNIPGQDRLPVDLDTVRPEVLLLMEGTNDLINAPSAAIGVELAAVALDQMVAVAKARGVTVLLATIAPQRYPPPAGTRDRSSSGPFVVPLNNRIKQIAEKYSVVLVDVYAAMNADLAGTIGIDNLHPTQKGLDVIADTFYAAIRQTLDVTPSTTSSFFRR